MDHSQGTTGHRVDALIRLDQADKERLLAGVFRSGSRSVMFRLFDAARYEDGDMFGAVIDEVDDRTDGLLHVRLRFWNELAVVYAMPGARFDVWYVRTVGHGVVLPCSPGDEERL